MFNFQADLMVQREDFIETKNLFKKALIYEFELNRRDKIFLKNFEEVYYNFIYNTLNCKGDLGYLSIFYSFFIMILSELYRNL